MITPSMIPLTRTFMRQKYRVLPSRSLSVPHPDDAPHASTADGAAHRVLLLGNDYAISWGVRTHALGLPGQLSRELSARSGFGADVDVISDPGLSITDVLTALENHDLAAYDAVVVLTGLGDAYTLLPPVKWVRLFQQLTTTLTSKSDAQITVVGIQPASSVNICHSKEHGLIDRWAETLNEVTESLCLNHARIHYLKAPEALPDILDDVDRLRFKSPTVHKAWAVSLARHLLPILPDHTPAPGTDRFPADAPQDAAHRSAAVECLGVDPARLATISPALSVVPATCSPQRAPPFPSPTSTSTTTQP